MITVVIPTHQPDIFYLRQSLLSIKGVDHIILHVNGGSIIPNDLEILVNNTIMRDNKNLSCPDALNKLINCADDGWIIPFTDDDEFYTDQLLILIEKINRGDYNDVDIINTRCLINNKKVWGDLNPTFEKLKNNNCIPFSSPYKKHVWQKIGGYHNEPCNDWGFWLRALKTGFKCKSYEQPLYNFKTFNNSLFKTEAKQGINNIRNQLLRNINAQLS